MFTVDDGLLTRARTVFASRPGLRFVLGGAGTGKSAVCAELANRRGLEVLDMDARLYGSWHGRFDPRRHPASHAWSVARDPLAWQVDLEPATFLAFHAAATAEGLDLLADELTCGRTGAEPWPAVLIDGGFGSLAVVARTVSVSAIACVSLPPGLRSGVWTGDDDRWAFLGVVAGVTGVDDPVGRFLALDEAMTVGMEADARSAGVGVIVRRRGEPVATTAARVADALGLG